MCSPKTCKSVFNPNVTFQLSQIAARVCTLVLYFSSFIVMVIIYISAVAKRTGTGIGNFYVAVPHRRTGDIRGVPWDIGNARATHRARARALDMETAARARGRARARATVARESSVDLAATNLRLL